MPTRVLDRRARNRALLARQLLLRRVSRDPVRAVGHLVGLQAQTPRSPYTALWSRLAGFDPVVLSRALERRRLVRIALMRSTIHLVTAADALLLRPLVLDRLMAELAVPWRRRLLDGLDLAAVAARSRELLEERPLTPAQLGAALAETWPDRDAGVLAQVARAYLPLVQLPPRGTWHGALAPTVTTAEHWLGRPVDTGATWQPVLLRYLAAFGPATAADAVAWSRITGLAEAFERLRPRLVVLRSAEGRELFDVPRAPRPAAGTPAPVRFLPDYDNVFLGHAERGHVLADDVRRSMQSTNGVLPGAVLVDGFVRASWTLRRGARTAQLLVTERDDLTARERAEVRAEAAALVAFLAPDLAGDVATATG